MNLLYEKAGNAGFSLLFGFRNTYAFNIIDFKSSVGS